VFFDTAQATAEHIATSMGICFVVARNGTGNQDKVYLKFSILDNTMLT
jgi:hypothetical protein